MKVKGETEKTALKLDIQKTKIMGSCPITSWQLDGETMETVRDFTVLCSKITADGDCSHEIKRHLLLGRKVMNNIDSTLKSRDITLPTKVQFSSVQFSHSVVSDFLWPHESQHARPPCPSPTPGVHSNSCPLSQWCHPIISSSVIPFSSCLQSFPASGSFPISQFFLSVGQSIGASASESVLPMNMQDWFPLGLTGWISLQSKGLASLLQHHSSKASILQHSTFFMVQLSHPYMTTGKSIF